MERKIGEIFEHNGEWYQCVEQPKNCIGEVCEICDFHSIGNCEIDECSGRYRIDKQNVIFNKLGKVGGTYAHNSVIVQKYRIRATPVIMQNEPYMYFNAIDNTIAIELKQTKEDMEEKKLIELLSEKVHNAWMKEKEAQGFSYGKDYDKEKKKHPDMLPYNELKEEVKEYDRATVRAVLQAQKELQSKYNYNNLKSFDLEAAKQGKPVCTREGRKARIVCFDAKGMHQPIIALITQDNGVEYIETYYSNGRFNDDINSQSDYDLMILPEKKVGWINIYKGGKLDADYIYPTKADAVENIFQPMKDNYIDTIKLTWEE